MLSQDRQEVLDKIKEYEKNGFWDKDVENDPETIELLPEKIDYLGEKLFTRIATRFANKRAIAYFEKKIKKGAFIIKEVIGIENYLSVKGGAILTCNHFNAFDNYAVFRPIKPYLDKEKRNLYKVIREGNYTNFKGFYGFLFRHCNTLPLSSNFKTMKKLLNAISVLLHRGEKILIYPEQAMWWNYKKPRPLKNGVFNFAVKNNVPVIPAFITMEDTENLDASGYPIQAYTVHYLPPIYPKSELTEKENIEYLKNENFDRWKDVYEKTYKVKLEY